MGVNLSMDNIHEFNEEYNKIGKNLSNHLIKFDGEGKIHVEKKPSIFTRLFSPTFSKEGYTISNASDLTKNLQAMKQNLENYETKNCTQKDLNELKEFVKNVNNTLEYIKIHKTAGRSVEERKSIDALFDKIMIKSETSKSLEEKGKDLRTALLENPKDFLAHGQMGELFMTKGDLSQAKHHFKKAIALDPKYAFAHARLGEVYREEKNLDKAREHFAKASSLDRKDSFSLARLGDICIEKGQWKRAKSYLESADHLNKRVLNKTDVDTFIYSRRGLVEGMNGLKKRSLVDFQNGVDLLGKAIESDPKDVFALKKLAFLHTKNNALADAEKCLLEADSVKPGDFETCILLSQLYEKRDGVDDLAKEEKYLKKALKSEHKKSKSEKRYLLERMAALEQEKTTETRLTVQL